MAVITWAMVVDHAPHLSTIDADAQTDILAYVNTALRVSVFGGEDSPKLKLARIYLAAHLATMGRQAGSGGGLAGGEITSESVGSISRSYAGASSGATSEAGLGSTVWGRSYLALVKTSALARMPIVM